MKHEITEVLTFFFFYKKKDRTKVSACVRTKRLPFVSLRTVYECGAHDGPASLEAFTPLVSPHMPLGECMTWQWSSGTESSLTLKTFLSPEQVLTVFTIVTWLLGQQHCDSKFSWFRFFKMNPPHPIPLTALAKLLFSLKQGVLTPPSPTMGVIRRNKMSKTYWLCPG